MFCSKYGCREGILFKGDEDLAEVGWFAEIDNGGCFKEIVCGGV
jgi:hypothetical protein